MIVTISRDVRAPSSSPAGISSNSGPANAATSSAADGAGGRASSRSSPASCAALRGSATRRAPAARSSAFEPKWYPTAARFTPASPVIARTEVPRKPRSAKRCSAASSIRVRVSGEAMREHTYESVSGSPDALNLSLIEESGILPAGTAYFAEAIPGAYTPARQRVSERAGWFIRARQEVAGCDLVFLDPDDGLAVR